MPRKRKAIAPHTSATSFEKSSSLSLIENVDMGELIEDLMGGCMVEWTTFCVTTKKQCTPVSSKPRCIQFIEAMDVRFGIHNGNLNR